MTDSKTDSPEVRVYLPQIMDLLDGWVLKTGRKHVRGLLAEKLNDMTDAAFQAGYDTAMNQVRALVGAEPVETSLRHMVIRNEVTQPGDRVKWASRLAAQLSGCLMADQPGTIAITLGWTQAGGDYLPLRDGYRPGARQSSCTLFVEDVEGVTNTWWLELVHIVVNQDPVLLEGAGLKAATSIRDALKAAPRPGVLSDLSNPGGGRRPAPDLPGLYTLRQGDTVTVRGEVFELAPGDYEWSSVDQRILKF